MAQGTVHVQYSVRSTRIIPPSDQARLLLLLSAGEPQALFFHDDEAKGKDLVSPPQVPKQVPKQVPILPPSPQPPLPPPPWLVSSLSAGRLDALLLLDSLLHPVALRHDSHLPHSSSLESFNPRLLRLPRPPPPSPVPDLAILVPQPG